jgi:ribokinase
MNNHTKKLFFRKNILIFVAIFINRTDIMSIIAVIGSSNTDMVVKAERLPVPGETVSGGVFLMNPGGKGANQAVAAARLGGNVIFITKTGNDLFGRQSIELYRTEGIDTKHVFSDPDRLSGVALIAVDAHGENCILVAPGANATLSVADVEQARETIESADYLLMQLETPLATVEYAATLASAKGCKVILNPAPAQALTPALLKTLNIIIPNRTEAELLTGIKISDNLSRRAAADCLSAKGVENVIITLGAEGAFVKEGNVYYEIAAEEVRAVDTTAAGDTFCGALCVGISEGMILADAVKFACHAAAISVTRMGAQASIPCRRELTVDY